MTASHYWKCANCGERVYTNQWHKCHTYIYTTTSENTKLNTSIEDEITELVRKNDQLVSANRKLSMELSNVKVELLAVSSELEEMRQRYTVFFQIGALAGVVGEHCGDPDHNVDACVNCAARNKLNNLIEEADKAVREIIDILHRGE